MSYNDKKNTIISSSLFIVCANVGKDWLLGNRFRPYVVLMSLIVCHKKYSHLHLYCMCLESGAVQFSPIPSQHHAFRQYFPHLLFMYVFMGIIVFGNDSHFNAETLSLQGPSYSSYPGNNTSKAKLRHLFGYFGSKNILLLLLLLVVLVIIFFVLLIHSLFGFHYSVGCHFVGLHSIPLRSLLCPYNLKFSSLSA